MWGALVWIEWLARYSMGMLMEFTMIEMLIVLTIEWVLTRTGMRCLLVLE
jgi:hypothetical protein